MKKTLALVLALLMMLSSMAFAEEVDYYKKGGFDGLTFTQIGSAAQDLPEGQDLNHNITKRYLELRLGIVPEYLWISNGDAYTTKLNSMIMTGDIPDMLEVNLAQYDQLVKSGLVADLTDILDTYLCPELKEAYAGADNTDLQAVTRNGRIYGLPQTNGMGDGSPLFWIRKDWMEKLNLEEPKTYEDIANIARAFMTQDPDGDGENNTYGLPIMPSYTANYGGEGNCGDIFLNNGGAAPGQWRLQEDGTVIYGSLMDGAKEALGLLNSWYAEGLIPSDFATWDSTTFKQAIAGGKAGICMGPWWDGWGAPGDTLRADPNADWAVYTVTKEENGQLYSQARGPASLSIIVVREGYEHPEAIIQMVNALFVCEYINSVEEIENTLVEEGYCTHEDYYTLLNNFHGMSAVHNSTPTRMFDLIDSAFAPCVDGVITVDEMVEQLKAMAINQSEIDCYTQAYDDTMVYRNDPDGRHNQVEAYVTYLCRYVAVGALVRGTNVQYVMTDYNGNTEAMAMYKTFLDDFEKEAYTKMIMGDTNGMTIDEYFETFTESWLAQGGAEVTASVQAEMDAR